MILDEDPAALISNCIANFNIAPDKSSLKRTHAALSSLSGARSQLLARHRATLAGLQRQLDSQHNAHSVAVQGHSAPAHAAEMLRLDTDKFRLAKEATDLEIEGERLAKEIGGARRMLEDVEADVESGGNSGAQRQQDGGDEMVLKLKVYRMLGIDVEPDAETGVYSKAVVRNRDKGDVRVVNIDNKFSRYFYADYFWNSL